MSRAQLAVTVTVIAAIIAFTVGVKIAASNTTAPKIVLPEAVTAPVVRMPTEAPNAAAQAQVMPAGSAATVPSLVPQVPVAQVAPAPVLPALPVPPHEAGPAAPTPGPGGVASPLPVPAPRAGGAAVAAMQQGLVPTVAPAPAPAPLATAAVAAPPAPAPAVAAEPATPETDRREVLEEHRRAQTNGAVNALLAVQQQLTTGDTSGVDRALQSAAPAMNAVGQGALQQARQALANKDLASAAQLINQAVLTASATPAVP